MFEIRLLKEAELDVIDACNWYEDKQKGLGKRFVREVNSTLQRIGKAPHHFQVRFSEVFRFAPLKRFPYLIVYKILEEERTAIVNAVFHSSKDPQNF